MALPAFEADYLFLAPLIKARLEGKVADVAVDICETAEQVYKSDLRQVVLMVMWGGDVVPEQESARAGAGASQVIHQRWGVLLALANPSQFKDARQVQAGPLLSKIHKALAGWTPEGCSRPFRRANAPLRPDIQPQKAIFPMGFEVQLTL